MRFLVLSLGVLSLCACSFSQSSDETYYLLKNKFSELQRYTINNNLTMLTDMGSDGQSKRQVELLAKRIEKFTEVLTNNFELSGLDREITLVVFDRIENYYEYLNSNKKYNIHTPYGFYQAGSRVIVVNYRAGDGTITHELVHALLEDDSKRIPIWLNEGLASLYEECIIKDGILEGVLNWRFDTLKDLMHSKMNFVSWLMGLDTDKFYDEDPEKSYAIVRLFCYFLQEKGILINYYKSLKKNSSDKYGVSTIQPFFNASIEEINGMFKHWALQRF